MADDPIELTRRRIVAGVGVIGAAGAVAGGGTMAFFSDQVDSEDNTIQAGTLDLTTNGNENPTAAINISGVAPGQSGSESLNLNNQGSIDGFLSLDFGIPDSRNDLTELLKVTVTIDGTVIRKGTFDTVFDGEGEWSNADIPLNAGATRTLEFEYELPGGAGNATQGLQAIGDFTILLNQQQEAFADLVVDPDPNKGNVSTISEGITDSPAGGVVLVRDGTYNEAVTVDKAGLKIASKNGPSNTELVANASTQNNKALLVDGVDDVTIDGIRVSLGAPQASNSEKFGIRGRPDGSGDGPNNLTVRNCLVENITSQDVQTNTGAVRATGIVVDLEPTGGLGPATVNDIIIENNIIHDIKCVGEIMSGTDSKAKGIAINGDADTPVVVENRIQNIGTASGDDPNQADLVNDSSNVGLPSAAGTDKPRGISLTEDSNDDGPTNFTILNTLIQGVAGTFGQPAIFIGGTNGLGSDEEVYDNEFHHPVDNLSSGVLKLRNNTWVDDFDDDGLPELVSPDDDEDGGNLIKRGGGSYDTTFALQDVTPTTSP